MRIGLLFAALVAAFAITVPPTAYAGDSAEQWVGAWTIREQETGNSFTLTLQDRGGQLVGDLAQAHRADKSAFGMVRDGQLTLSFRDRNRPDDDPGRAHLNLQPGGRQFTGDCRYGTPQAQDFLVHWTGMRQR
ncbi:MAG: hypothetical protein ACREHE_15165 [Rhizomicrobium sp.]